MVQTAIKRGPMLRHIDSRMITNPRYQRYALDLAEKLGIPVQDAVRSAGSTNGAVIHLTEKQFRSLLLVFRFAMRTHITGFQLMLILIMRLSWHAKFLKDLTKSRL